MSLDLERWDSGVGRDTALSKTTWSLSFEHGTAKSLGSDLRMRAFLQEYQHLS